MSVMSAHIRTISTNATWYETVIFLVHSCRTNARKREWPQNLSASVFISESTICGNIFFLSLPFYFNFSPNSRCLILYLRDMFQLLLHSLLFSPFNTSFVIICNTTFILLQQKFTLF